MKKYRILITETLQKVVEVEAENFSDAYDLVVEKYRDGNIVLDYDDFIDSQIENFTSETKDGEAKLFYKVDEEQNNDN